MRMLPVQILPQPNEVFLSWFVRLAHAHGERTQSLAYQLWGRKRMVGAGSAFQIEGEHLEPVCDATGLSIEAVKDLTMESMVGFLWNDVQAKGARKWVLPTGDKLRKDQRFGQQACPGCLRDDIVPYFRKSWRLAIHAICPVHRSTLIDRCQRCGFPILLERLDIGMFVPTAQAAAYRCWMCGADLREADCIPDADETLIDYQLLLLDCLNSGFINVGGRIIYSTQFFEGLWILWSFLDDNRWSKGLGIASEVGAKNRMTLSHAEPARRRTLLCRVGGYLSDWPDRFVTDMSREDLSGGKLFRFHKRIPGKDVPFWLWEPVHWYLNRTIYVPPDAEIMEAARLVCVRDGFVRCSEVAKLLNMRTRSSARVFAMCRTVSSTRSSAG